MEEETIVEETTIVEEQAEKKGKINSGNQTSAIYGLGMIGAGIYFVSTATSFWMGVIGVLKAIVWPVILVYEALAHFGA